MTSRRFTLEDQLALAELSGDYNPLHVDPVAARRLLYGAPVVHGVHTLLWALESWLGGRTEPMQLRRVRCAFLKPLRVGDEANLSFQTQNGPVRVDVLCGQVVVAKIEWECEMTTSLGKLESRGPEKGLPRDLSPEEIEGRSGQIELLLDSKAATQRFPHVLQCLGEQATAALLATTRLVGMECPGLRSVFSELTLAASEEHRGPTLQYKVTRLDPRFGLALMNVEVPGMAGTIKAFIRPQPQKQAEYAILKKLVKPGEFAGQRALVVGGSRGLGEVTAKLLSAGGAEVRITYRQGKNEAARIVEEIIAGGGSASSMELDVLAPQAASLAGWKPTHLYYFATPAIFVGSKGTFSQPVFDKFRDYYLKGFLNVMNGVKDSGVRKVFHPSSVAVDDPPADMAEYVAAKKEAELLCSRLEQEAKGLVIHRPRLPRMGTDQTVSLLPINNADPVPIMLEHLRTLRDS